MVVGLVSQEQIAALSGVVARLEAWGLEDESQVLREVLAQFPPTTSGMSVSVAAEILRLTPQNVRDWVRAGLLSGQEDRAGSIQVDLEALEPTIRLNRLMPNVTEALAAISDDDIAAEIEAVRAARRKAARPE